MYKDFQAKVVQMSMRVWRMKERNGHVPDAPI